MWYTGHGKSTVCKNGTNFSVLPWYTQLPTESTYTWSKIWNNLAVGWWIVQIMVLPCCANFLHNSSTLVHELLSRPLWKYIDRRLFSFKFVFCLYVVGSSRNITVGLFINSIAIESLFFCPPDSLIVIVWSCSYKPSSNRISSICMWERKW